MLSLLACGACGMDPATDTMLINLALAGAVSVPVIFREYAYRIVRRVRGKPGPVEDSCPLAPDPDDAE